MSDILTLRETINGLTYISESPERESGGFHQQTVLVAKSSLNHIDYYKRLAEAAGEYIDYHNDVNNTYEFDPVKFDKLFENYQSIKQERER
jgi:hypothetical protein